MGKIHVCQVCCGDCTVIQASSHTYLIDCHSIDLHRSLLPTSKRLRGVFITHQHRDHYSGLRWLKDNGYKIDFLIYSPYMRRHNDYSVTYDEWTEFEQLRDAFVRQGTEIRSPYRQDSFNEPFWPADDVKFWMLAPFQDLARSETRELHDGCLVVKVNAGAEQFLVTGDASDCSLNRIATSTSNYCNGVLRASHHGSLNGADLDFVKGANATYTMISTECGTHDNVPHPTALQRYAAHTKSRVYRTDIDGTIHWSF